MIKDGNFPTVDRPNPEFAEALTLGLNLAKKIDADILMASDPDADRIGMACKNDKGEWQLINGNQTALIFLWYIITNREAMGLMEAYRLHCQDHCHDRSYQEDCRQASY